MNETTKATFTGASFGLASSLGVVIVRYSMGQRDMSEIGLAILLVLFFTLFGAGIWYWAHKWNTRSHQTTSNCDPGSAPSNTSH
ncbi:MAG: hypothetical protein HLX51_10405 [Micrococcaceae bacterium]|nr:hypothetical protein [Micrococcaceae bacterium]